MKDEMTHKTPQNSRERREDKQRKTHGSQCCHPDAVPARGRVTLSGGDVEKIALGAVRLQHGSAKKGFKLGMKWRARRPTHRRFILFLLTRD